jgi:hypothetical protein
MAYKVTAPLVCAPDRMGKVRYHYQNAVIPWLDEDKAAYLLRIKMVEEVPDSEVLVPDEDGADEHYTADGHPKKVAPVAVWRDFRVSQGVVTVEEAAEMTKTELVELD